MVSGATHRLRRAHGDHVAAASDVPLSRSPRLDSAGLVHRLTLHRGSWAQRHTPQPPVQGGCCMSPRQGRSPRAPPSGPSLFTKAPPLAATVRRHDLQNHLPQRFSPREQHSLRGTPGDICEGHSYWGGTRDSWRLADRD